MENVITSKTFIVNVAPDEFNKPIDLSKTSIEIKNVRGKDGIIFVSLESTDSWLADVDVKIIDRWSFMNKIHRDEAFEKLLRLKYGALVES